MFMFFVKQSGAKAFHLYGRERAFVGDRPRPVRRSDLVIEQCGRTIDFEV